MSIELVRNEIARFLRSPEPEVLCVRGEWGVGKTYTWQKLLAEAAESNNIALNKYSYVSVYGLKEISDLRNAIFRNRIDVSGLKGGSNENSLASAIGSLHSNAKKYFPHAGDFFGEKGRAVSNVINDLAYQSVRDQIVCFDDLERSGEGLRVRDIMGVASSLKEERQCKVVLLLNEGRLDPRDQQDFRDHFEKVIDSSLKFQPTPSEAAAVGLDGDTTFHDKLREATENARITNIRIIRNIQRLVRQVTQEIEIDGRLSDQVCQTITAAYLIKFGEVQGVDLDQLRSYNDISRVLSEGEKNDPLAEILESLGYNSTDEIDLVLIGGVENGFIDYELLKSRVAEARLVQGRYGDSRFSLAWDKYHHSLVSSDEDVIDEIYRAVIEQPETVSLTNLNGTVRMFRNLGQDRLADDMVQKYFAAREFEPDALEEDVFVWNEGPVDPAIVAIFDEKVANYVDPRDPADVLLQMAKNQGWKDEDIKLLSDQDVAGLVDMFDRLQGPNLSRCIRMAMRFVGSEEDKFAQLGTNLTQAFEVIAARSKNNARKLKGFGFQPHSDFEANAG